MHDRGKVVYQGKKIRVITMDKNEPVFVQPFIGVFENLIGIGLKEAGDDGQVIDFNFLPTYGFRVIQAWRAIKFLERQTSIFPSAPYLCWQVFSHYDFIKEMEERFPQLTEKLAKSLGTDKDMYIEIVKIQHTFPSSQELERLVVGILNHGFDIVSFEIHTIELILAIEHGMVKPSETLTVIIRLMETVKSFKSGVEFGTVRKEQHGDPMTYLH